MMHGAYNVKIKSQFPYSNTKKQAVKSDIEDTTG